MVVGQRQPQLSLKPREALGKAIGSPSQATIALTLSGFGAQIPLWGLDTRYTACHQSGMMNPDYPWRECMTEPHKRPYRHPKYKTAYRVNNWREYEQSLRDRGDITLWLSHDAIDAWTPPQTGKRGAQPVYSETAIETALTLRLLFGLPLRQTEGFLGSLLRLMDLMLPCPDHTTLSRRHATGKIRRQIDRAPGGPIALIVDSTG